MQLTVDEYFKIFNKLDKTKNTFNLALKDCLNHVVSKNIKSIVNLPAFDNSAMDGYLFDRSLSLNGYIDRKIKIKNSIFAGDIVHDTLKEGECFKIMTGGMITIQEGVVIPLEYVNLQNDHITIDTEILKDAWKGSKHIRYKAENLKAGEIIIKNGEFLEFKHLSILASQGIEKVEVYKPLCIAIYSSGDEILKGRIKDVNSISIFSTLLHFGFKSNILGCLEDDLCIYKNNLNNALENYDVIILSGGASVGERDFSKNALNEIGAVIFCEKLFCKPGKPMLLAKKDSKIIIVLPGNPQATLMNLIIFVIPLLKYLSNADFRHKKIVAKNRNSFKVAKNITSNLLGTYKDGFFSVFNDAIINSNDISSFLKSNAIISVSGTEEIKENEEIDILIF